MLTIAEAMQRVAVNNAVIKRAGAGEWKCYLKEWTAKQIEARAYFTDDLLDAVLTIGKLREATNRAA